MLPVTAGPRLQLAAVRAPAVGLARLCSALAVLSFLALVPMRASDLVPLAALAIPFALFHASAFLSLAALTGPRRQGALALLAANLAPVGVFWLTVVSFRSFAGGL